MTHSPFPVGARVHHANQLWTARWTETERKANPQWGWGTVLEVKVFGGRDVPRMGDYEVMVRSDDGTGDRWWPGWLIDEVHPAVAA